VAAVTTQVVPGRVARMRPRACGALLALVDELGHLGARGCEMLE
jgi:hypothetical protein